MPVTTLRRSTNSKTKLVLISVSALIILLVALYFLAHKSTKPTSFESPHPGFIYVKHLIPNLKLEMRYCSTNNFTGRKVQGYINPVCILSVKAATALEKVQRDLNKMGLGLVIFDAYRPQQAVDSFVKWSKDSRDKKMKKQYYPNIAKKDLFPQGYIAAKSSHSRGSTLDLSIIDLKSGKKLDMGSGFDLFSKKSWPDYPELTAQQRANRLLLRSLMTKHGFNTYPYEWWHFTLKDEPFKETYFNFPVK
ncbi:M15 family metallopeptidase [Lentisphaerota bacterium ZTH]|nr:M15 family metallopeptidase [Lentisphaerota bacterium]WET06725.1 M15 family metallopeptidase [Lentisphaerota bacterium ZTH]